MTHLVFAERVGERGEREGKGQRDSAIVRA